MFVEVYTDMFICISIDVQMLGKWVDKRKQRYVCSHIGLP